MTVSRPVCDLEKKSAEEKPEAEGYCDNFTELAFDLVQAEIERSRANDHDQVSKE